MINDIFKHINAHIYLHIYMTKSGNKHINVKKNNRKERSPSRQMAGGVATIKSHTRLTIFKEQLSLFL
jgi:hypothetical protein